MRKLDLAGKTFGLLTPLRVVSSGDKRVWLCSCVCGGQVEAITYQLTSGAITRCRDVWHTVGYTKGQVVGELTLKDYVRPCERPDKKRGRRGYFISDCSCGKTDIKVFAKNLQRGKISCGCKRKPLKRKPIQEVVLTKNYSSYRGNARNKNRSFSLTFEDFQKIVLSSCHYCGEVDLRSIPSREETTYCNGVDRLDSDIGYVLSNCVSCCKDCNYLKVDRGYKSFLDKVNKIAKHRGILHEETKLKKPLKVVNY